jgi:hypothetical protein
MRANERRLAMKDKIFCRFEKKEVNVQYYECPNRFKNCRYCRKLKRSSEVQRSIVSKKQNHPDPNDERRQDLFSDWNIYPLHCHWSRKPRSKKLIPDFIVGLEDSAILESLIYEFDKEANEGRAKGMEKFWRKAEQLCQWKKGNWECLIEEEKRILSKAKDGSIEAIQKLVIANPKLIHVPFVADIMENLIRTVKFKEWAESKRARKSWGKFLPKRVHNKHIVTNEYLAKALTKIIEVRKCTKKDAEAILHRSDRSLKKERLRKISVGVK